MFFFFFLIIEYVEIEKEMKKKRKKCNKIGNSLIHRLDLFGGMGIFEASKLMVEVHVTSKLINTEYLHRTLNKQVDLKDITSPCSYGTGTLQPVCV